eukprot:CAMPEP_0119041124 /NCGR_PEP_ID=MMETSP1177-20130426/11294_1 /TAXON_ID=2985 /ORGANISM="Ochromonas sp, Strain CCMP1899" /LENGTH=215 /DNA_ID=CAMNT_0007006901 /DNA_START=112 /DNA_END=756 /DNA_ORIENTATION=+
MSVSTTTSITTLAAGLSFFVSSVAFRLWSEKKQATLEAREVLEMLLPQPKSYLSSEKILTGEGIFTSPIPLSVKDSIVIEMLNQQSDQCSFSISNPHLHSNPLIFVSNAFLTLTGYEREEVLLRNCKFLQGSATERTEVAALRLAIKNERQGSAELLNFKKNGEKFYNHLYIVPLFDTAGKLAYYLGVQAQMTEPPAKIVAETRESDKSGLMFTW